MQAKRARISGLPTPTEAVAITDLSTRLPCSVNRLCASFLDPFDRACLKRCNRYWRRLLSDQQLESKYFEELFHCQLRAEPNAFGRRFLALSDYNRAILEKPQCPYVPRWFTMLYINDQVICKSARADQLHTNMPNMPLYYKVTTPATGQWRPRPVHHRCPACFKVRQVTPITQLRVSDFGSWDLNTKRELERELKARGLNVRKTANNDDLIAHLRRQFEWKQLFSGFRAPLYHCGCNGALVMIKLCETLFGLKPEPSVWDIPLVYSSTGDRSAFVADASVAALEQNVWPTPLPLKLDQQSAHIVLNAPWCWLQHFHVRVCVEPWRSNLSEEAIKGRSDHLCFGTRFELVRRANSASGKKTKPTLLVHAALALSLMQKSRGHNADSVLGPFAPALNSPV